MADRSSAREAMAEVTNDARSHDVRKPAKPFPAPGETGATSETRSFVDLLNRIERLHSPGAWEGTPAGSAPSSSDTYRPELYSAHSDSDSPASGTAEKIADIQARFKDLLSGMDNPRTSREVPRSMPQVDSPASSTASSGPAPAPGGGSLASARGGKGAPSEDARRDAVQRRDAKRESVPKGTALSRDEWEAAVRETEEALSKRPMRQRGVRSAATADGEGRKEAAWGTRARGREGDSNLDLLRRMSLPRGLGSGSARDGGPLPVREGAAEDLQGRILRNALQRQAEMVAEIQQRRQREETLASRLRTSRKREVAAAGRLEKAQEEIERLKAESAPDSATLTQVEHRLAALEEAHERTQEENRALRERARKLEREAEAARAEARARKEEAEEAKAGAARAVAEAEAARGRVKALEVAAAEAAEARKQSREALREMAEQNARLVAAFVSKKDEARRAREEAAEQRRHAEAREADASALLAARAAEIESLRCVVERLRAALRGVGEHEARASGDVAGHQEGGGEEGEGEATPLGERVGEEGGTSEGEGEGGAEEEAANTEERRRQRRALLEELGRAGGEGFRAQEEGLRTHEEGSGARGEPGAGPRAPLKRWQSSPAVGRGEGGRGGHGDGTPVSQRGAPGRGGDGDGDGGSADTPTSADTSLSPVRPGYRPRGESGGDVGVEEESASFGANAGLRGAGGDGDRAPMGTEPEAGTESSSWGGMPRRGKCQSETWSGGAWSGTEGGGSAEGTGRREEESCSAESARRGPAGGEEEAQRLKEAGNALFREGKYKEACARYTSALEEAGSDRTRAVLRSNRAAAHLASGSYADALVDSLAAQSLDDSYARSFQRSAEAYAAVGDYASAHQSLVELHRRAPSLLVGDLSGKMYAWQRKAQTQTDLDHYALLGVTEGASEKEIRVAYRKLALRLHPDKATCVASRESNDQIFKLISRAHATLSDAEQRRQYDASRARRRLQRAFTTGMSSMPGFGFSGFASHGRYSYGRF